MYDETKNEFIQYPAVTLQLEHSLLSVSKWESKWKKPFMSQDEKPYEEFLDYVRCMTINSKVDPTVYSRLSQRHFKVIEQYIHDPMTATTFHNWKEDKISRETITSELVYYWMTAAQIPWEAEKWHFNRLMTLIRIYGIKNDSGKMSKKDAYNQYRALNAARRKPKHH